MCNYDRVTLQRAISKAYKESEHCVDGAMQKLNSMIDLVELLDPKTEAELFEASLAVIEEFSDESSAT